MVASDTRAPQSPGIVDTRHLLIGQRVLALARIAIGWTFLWAFLDKTFGLGISTAHDKAWLFGTGGDPTSGYLSSIDGPFAWLFNPLAGQAWVSWLFMIGLLGIGVGLMTGLAFRFSAICGVLMFGLMYLSSLPIDSNPFVDEHLIEGLVLVALIPLWNGRVWGLSSWWEHTVGTRLRWLR